MRTLLLALASVSLVSAQTAANGDINARIRKEEADHSQIMHTLHMLTDRYGPRMTGTPNLEAAARWVARQLTDWGFQNAHLESWDFGHPGWLNDRASGFIVSPVKANLKFEVLAWTPSTKGTVTGSAVELVLPQGPPIQQTADAAGRGGRAGPQFEQPTRAELTAWLDANKGKIRGKVVMLSKAAVLPMNFEPEARRLPDDQVRSQYDPNNPNAGRGRGGFGGGRGNTDPSRVTAVELRDMVDAWMIDNGALVRMNDAARDHGLIVAQQHNAYDPSRTIPTVIARNEDYGRIERLLADGEDVKLEFNIQNTLYPDGKTTYNVLGEIPGTDKANEIVMLGGHLDSWHSATGATDNGIGSSMMLEAARIIQALGLKPRRTIRVALGAARRRACWDRWLMSNNISAPSKIPSPSSPRWIATSTSIAEPAAPAARACLDRPPLRRSCARLSIRSPILG